jgi:tetratricopeptide (TPR) repeat protein
VLLAAALLAAVAAGGVAYLTLFREKAPSPPEVPDDGNEPAVAAAVRLVRERVLKEPRSSDAWGDLGKVFLANDLAAESRACFAQADRLDPRNPRWPYFLGELTVSRGDRSEAVAYLRRAVELGAREDPGNVTARLLLAETLLALGQLDEAEAEFGRVLARQPDDVRAHLGLGRLAAAREDWETSRSHLLRCLDSPRARQKASVQLAAVCQRLGDAAGADKYRTQAERLPPDGPWDDPYLAESAGWAVSKRNRLAQLKQLEWTGRFAEAAAVARQLAEDFPDDFFPRLALARDVEELGDHQRAKESLRDALRLAPDNVQVRYYLSRVLVAEGEELSRQGDGDRARAADLFREAAEQARRVVAVRADFGPAYVELGLALKHLGERAAAVEGLRQAVRCNPESAQFHYQLGDALADEGQEAEARHHLEEALEFGEAEARWRPAAAARLAALKKQ